MPKSTGSPHENLFRQIARQSTIWSGSWQFFIASVAGVLAWASLGPAMGFTDTWQLLVNTPTTILSYLLGILILLEANRQSRESKVVHDELLRAVRAARTELIAVDEMSDEELDRIEGELKRRAAQARAATEQTKTQRRNGRRRPRRARSAA